MTFDVEHSRCDLSKTIDCKNGERPNWNPPSDCRFSYSFHSVSNRFDALGQTEMITERTTIKTSTIPYDEPIETERTRPLTMNPTTITSSKFAFSRMLLPNRIPMGNTPCTFQGTRSDSQDYQCTQNEYSFDQLFIDVVI